VRVCVRYFGDRLTSCDCLDRTAKPQTCTRCGYMSSNAICKACVLLEGLSKGKPRMGVIDSKRLMAGHIDPE
jgi:hypothetical protein